MTLLKLTKTLPIRNEKFVLTKWEKQGEIRLAPDNIESVVVVPEMDGKVHITMRSGSHFFVEEDVETVDDLYSEACYQ